jgi:[ribulose-bisphosphate carboxylase]/[fructose-bisphosphate aldolase]-lysine N-methyltransferase
MMSAATTRPARLAEWLKSESGVKLDPALSVDPVTGRLALLSNVGKGASLLELPATAVLSSSDAASVLGNAASSLEPPAALAMLLLAERARGEESRFAAMISTLPEAMNQPFLWSNRQLDSLKGSALREKALAVRAGIEEEWTEVCELLKLSVALEDYLWAQAIVTSRAFALGSAFPLVLAPVADLADHAVPGEIATVAAVVGGGKFFSKPRFLLCTTAEVSAGAALTVDHVDDSDAGAGEYILDYGFVPEGVPLAVDVCFSMAPLDPFYEDKLDILELNEEVKVPVFSLRNASSRGLWTPPEFMEAFVRLLCLGATDAFLLEAVFRKDVYGFMELPVSRANEEAMCEAIIAACEDILDGYEPSCEGILTQEDLDGDATSAERAALATAIVEGEVNVLRATIVHYRKRLQSLDAIEYYQDRRLKALDLLRPLDESEIVDAEGGGRMGQAFDDNY